MRLDVIEVVEEQPADSKIAEIVEACSRRSLSPELDTQLVVVGVIGEWDVGEEPASLVLKRAKNGQMLDAVVDCLDVAIEHGAVGANAKPVRSPMNRDPIFSSQLLIGDLHSHTAAEHFGASSRQSVEAGFAECRQHLLDRHFLDARDVRSEEHTSELQS